MSLWDILLHGIGLVNTHHKQQSKYVEPCCGALTVRGTKGLLELLGTGMTKAASHAWRGMPSGWR